MAFFPYNSPSVEKQPHRLSAFSCPQFVLFLFRRAERKAVQTGKEIFLPTPNFGHLPPHDPRYKPAPAYLTVSLPQEQNPQPSATMPARDLDEIPHMNACGKDGRPEDLEDVIFTLAPTTLSLSYGKSRQALLLRLQIGRS
ncbi:MAG: hypothetical protein RBT70_08630 [Alphaproteobacteria bacterium]|jgi:hypothetical protein|nr:hypothetical protein [Alphaproteobacteria bacterium]